MSSERFLLPIRVCESKYSKENSSFRLKALLNWKVSPEGEPFYCQDCEAFDKCGNFCKLKLHAPQTIEECQALELLEYSMEPQILIEMAKLKNYSVEVVELLLSGIRKNV